MDFTKLKSLAKKLGGILIVNGNEPDVVILDYNKYIELENGPGLKEIEKPVLPTEVKTESANDLALIESLNKEIQALHNEMKEVEKSQVEEVEIKEV